MRAIQFHNHLALSRLPFVGTISVRIIVDCLICPLRIKAVMLANQKPEAARAREGTTLAATKAIANWPVFATSQPVKTALAIPARFPQAFSQCCPTPGCFRPG